MVEWHQVALAGACGGLLALERRAFLQAMFSRPLVAATVTGWMLNDVTSGLYVGLPLELFFLGSASLGAALPENDTLTATGTAAAAAAMAVTSGGGGTPALWALALLLFLGLGKLGRVFDRALEKYTTGLAKRAITLAQAGELDSAVRSNLRGMWPYFVLFGGTTAACALIGLALGKGFHLLPLPLVRGLAWAYPVLAAVTAAIAVRGSHARRAWLMGLLGALLVLLAATGHGLWRAR